MDKKSSNKVFQAAAESETELQPMSNAANTKVGPTDGWNGSSEDSSTKGARVDHLQNLGPVITGGDARHVYYIIDAETLRSGKAMIDVRDKSADASPLGLLGFGLTTFLLNMCNAGVFEFDSMILAMGLFYGGAAQVLAGIFEWSRGNTIGMVAFASYGFFWMSFAFTVSTPAMGTWAPPPSATGLAWYLFIWGLFSLVMFAATIVKKAPIFLSWLFLTVVVLFWLLASYYWTLHADVLKAAGIEGIICGLSAIYMAAAEILNSLNGGRTILPVFPRK
jgi:succinate-acetate transporter protein